MRSAYTILLSFPWIVFWENFLLYVSYICCIFLPDFGIVSFLSLPKYSDEKLRGAPKAESPMPFNSSLVPLGYMDLGSKGCD